MEKEVPADHLHVFSPSFLFEDDESEIDESDLNSTLGFLVYEFRNFFIDNIPIEVIKDLPKFGKASLPSFTHCLFHTSPCFLQVNIL
jgi:hypothetical protein